MPDLSEQLSAILQNPEAQKNIQNLLSSLGQNQPQNSENSAPSFDFSSLLGQSRPQNQAPAIPDIDIGMLMKLQGIFSKMSCDDSSVNLLRALRPHLKNPQKIDGAINILRLMSVLPALEQSGIFGGDPR